MVKWLGLEDVVHCYDLARFKNSEPVDKDNYMAINFIAICYIIIVILLCLRL